MVVRANGISVVGQFASPEGAPPAGMREVAKPIAKARFVEIDPAGHLSSIENRNAFNAARTEFLDAAPG
ncbi:MAG: alpha/beta hydrolase [Alphaproteobacteria bacterium]|nr:alpha/beta hydrolase [Alphaproteobacteria bacterium]MCZ6509551.1 alpha/beta hydrolase [Alphaproteobacteria bacterium]MCZ6586729.1 alpha/beta hydrolase [Alphaproteobacteria bacterium]MCZ6592281.1 alpha/beta hydrolase [Alphaproteobacteria bacterium]MCZ6840456.1 alpha/beta hydrolase [Alphaproteobacteria bacterium]